MSLRLICTAHTPVMTYPDAPAPRPACEPQLRAVFGDLRAQLRAFDPQLVVLFGPDHFNGFFYDAMPGFCLGAAAQGAGDFGGPSDVVPVDAATTLACVEQLQRDGFDPAVSYDMRLDHGFTQPLSLLFDAGAQPSVLPIYVNCVAPPQPSYARVRALGASVGRWAASTGLRVLIIGSGGLSHDPPVPDIATAPPEVRNYLVNGRSLPPEIARARQARVVNVAHDFAAGLTDLTPLNPAWDREIMRSFAIGDLDRLATLDDAEVIEVGGRGGREVRTWLAAFAALESAGAYDAATLFYEPIAQWLAGFGVMSAATRVPAIGS